MILSTQLSDRIVAASYRYLDRPFDWDTFNCIHFVRRVYGDVGIVFPALARSMLPPDGFHLSSEEFGLMPLGRSVFLKRKAKATERPWSHVAIIVGPDKLIHCTRHMGESVIVSSKDELMRVYDRAPSQ